MRRSTLHFAAPLLAAHLAITGLAGCDDNDDDNGPIEGEFFVVHNLVSDQAGLADNTDPELVNPWGIAFGDETFFWVANNGTLTSTLYDGDGTIQSQAIGGPVSMVTEQAEAMGPTGVVFNGGAGFQVSGGGVTAPSAFIFATLEGTLLGWSPEVDLRRGLIAVSVDDALFTGLAIAHSANGPRLFAANFLAGRVDVFDDGFTRVDLGRDAFVDPDLPDEFGPFGIQEIDGLIYVSYAPRDDEGEEIAGPGNGVIDVFDTDGALIDRVVEGGPLNAPWGMVKSPSGFGQFANALLVGNFGDGRILAIDPDRHAVMGHLETGPGEPIELEGLWGITFGNGRNAGDPDDLYFNAGIDDETHGLFGEIAVAGEEE